MINPEKLTMTKEKLIVIGAKLKAWREAEKIKQKELAEIIGTSPSNLSKIEHGKALLNAYQINLIMEQFHPDPYIFFYYTPSEMVPKEESVHLQIPLAIFQKLKEIHAIELDSYIKN